MIVPAPKEPLSRGLGGWFVARKTLASRRWAGLFLGVLLRRRGRMEVVPAALSLGVIWSFFQLQDSNFLSARNLSNLIVQSAVAGTVAIGVVLMLLIGDIDLSIGSVAGVTAALLAILVAVHQAPWWLGIMVMIFIGAAIGAFHGAWTVVTRVPSFIVTLAGLLAWFGVQLHLILSLGTNTINVLDPTILGIADSYLPVDVGWGLALGAWAVYAMQQVLGRYQRGRANLPVKTIAQVLTRILASGIAVLASTAVLNQWRGIPTSTLILVGLVAFFAWLTTRTPFGRHMYAIGGNVEAARRAGINVARVRITVFALSSLLATAGGLIAVSRSASAGTLTGGGTLLLEAIAAAVIGGASLFGGRGSVWAALLGALVIGSVSNGLDLMGQAGDITFIVQGSILLIAVTIDALVRRGQATAR